MSALLPVPDQLLAAPTVIGVATVFGAGAARFAEVGWDFAAGRTALAGVCAASPVARRTARFVLGAATVGLLRCEAADEAVVAGGATREVAADGPPPDAPQPPAHTAPHKTMPIRFSRRRRGILWIYRIACSPRSRPADGAQRAAGRRASR
jgi:hypothetical protein